MEWVSGHAMAMAVLSLSLSAQFIGAYYDHFRVGISRGGRLCALSQVSLQGEFFFLFLADMRLGTGHGSPSPALFILFFLLLLCVMD